MMYRFQGFVAMISRYIGTDRRRDDLTALCLFQHYFSHISVPRGLL